MQFNFAITQKLKKLYAGYLLAVLNCNLCGLHEYLNRRTSGIREPQLREYPIIDRTVQQVIVK